MKTPTLLLVLVTAILLAACGKQEATAVPMARVAVKATPAPSAPVASADEVALPAIIRTWKEYDNVKMDAWKRSEKKKMDSFLKYQDFEDAELRRIKTIDEKVYFQILEADRFYDYKLSDKLSTIPIVAEYKKKTESEYAKYKQASDAAYNEYKKVDAAAYEVYRKTKGD